MAVGAVAAADDRCVAVLSWRGQATDGGAAIRETVGTLRIDDAGKIVEHWGSEVRSERLGSQRA